MIYRSEGIALTGYFFPAHDGWGKGNSEKFFSARRRRRRRRRRPRPAALATSY